MYRADRFDRVNEFIAFCEKQPADKSYDWSNAEKCACGQFFGKADWFEDCGDIRKQSGIDINHISGVETWRFGPLAKRVRAAKMELASALSPKECMPKWNWHDY